MPKFRYRVLCGTHVVGDTTYGPTSPNGNVFETDRDLSRLTVGPQPHLELLEQKKEVTESVPTKKSEAVQTIESKQDDGLDTQSVAELKAFAADAKIDILGLNRKDEIVAAIRRAVAVS